MQIAVDSGHSYTPILIHYLTPFQYTHSYHWYCEAEFFSWSSISLFFSTVPRIYHSFSNPMIPQRDISEILH
jgi:hypothetical protein